MRNVARFALTPMFLLLLLATVAGAMENPRVDDKAGFFSADAISKANEIIAQIKRDHGKDLFIETLPSIPDELKSQYRHDQRAQFFQQLSDAHADAAKVDGVIVIITRDPSYLQVSAGPDTQRQAFVSDNIRQMRETMQQNFRAKHFDRGLLEGVEYVRSTFAQSLPKGGARGGMAGAPAAPSGRDGSASPRTPGQRTEPVPAPAPTGRTTPTRSPLGGMTTWLCVGAAALLLFTLFRAMRARSAQYGPGQHGAGRQAPYGGYQQGQQGHGEGYPQAPGGGGGGMGRGLLGGLLGGVLGGYAYDKFTNRPGESAGQDPGALGGGGGGSDQIEHPSSNDIGGDFTGSGGDFGDSGSGGGGGGDFGGGGDGGGGGDF